MFSDHHHPPAPLLHTFNQPIAKKCLYGLPSVLELYSQQCILVNFECIVITSITYFRANLFYFNLLLQINLLYFICYWIIFPKTFPSSHYPHSSNTSAPRKPDRPLTCLPLSVTCFGLDAFKILTLCIFFKIFFLIFFY